MKPSPRSFLVLGDLGALLGGAMLPLAFAPFGLSPLAMLSPACLFLLWTELSPGRSFWRGWLYGLGMFGCGVSWIQISIHQFGLPVLAFSVTVTLLFVAFLALFPAALGYVVNRFFPGPGWVRFLLVLPAAWTLLEWLRGWVLTGFPWLNLGYSQIDTPLAQLAPVLGVYGVSLAVAWSAGVIGYVFSRPRRLSLLVLLLPLWGGAWLMGKVSWTRPASEPIEAALIQGNITQTIKWSPAQYQATLDRYLTLSAPHWGVDLIVWPETAIPGFYNDAEPVVEKLKALSENTGTEVLIGVPFLASLDGEIYFNSVVQIGQEPRFYHKRHLVPFGEYLPLESILGRVLKFLAIPMSGFSAGAKAQPWLQAAGHPVGISICYEDAFGEEIIDALPEASLLVNVSNDAWFGDSIAPHQHLEMARMRALEAGRYLLRATNTGISAIIDPRGKILARSPQFEAHALVAKATPYQGATPYARFGNYPIVILLILLLGVGIAAQAMAWTKSPGAVEYQQLSQGQTHDY